MLRFNNVSGGYGDGDVLHSIEFTAVKGEISAIMGRNGVGKSSLLKAVMGMVSISDGVIRWDGQSLDRMSPHALAQRHIAYVPQGRRIFANMSVIDNIRVGWRASHKYHSRASYLHMLEYLWHLFPPLCRRQHSDAGVLSGGEQQMLALARALAVYPSLLLLDEPSEGLQPSLIDAIAKTLNKLKNEDTAIVLVEQKLDLVLQTSDSIAFMDGGVLSGQHLSSELSIESPIFGKYLGV